jgi:molybdopterin-guanine dinucleotide biosynthesis protein A
MGQDKALLTIQGVPLLRIVCDVAIALCDPVYVVTSWPERYQHLLSSNCQFIREVPLLGESRGAEVPRCRGEIQNPKPARRTLAKRDEVQSEDGKIQNPKSSQGPLVGFAQGLDHVQTDWVLLLACDLPRLRLEVLQDWAAELDLVAAEAIALLPRHAKGWEPLCGFYRRSCLTALTQYINQGGCSFQQWLAQHPVQALPLAEAEILFNCNTPADYAALEKFNQSAKAEEER